ncbi:oligosaccharide flippase family protein [Tetragenococcus koreensis]|uniref:oligosaccharide flippase family protein n=1 Tax=Tetragenococcus koreensis TaxID=290335 RepID=UPI001F157BDA|nr:oligosaccharide flippase family protein [Tetragenococcus koreensis]MCF1585812.1 oligosaccharide flippase family protein [Tetragenococcus koreensis]MCF1630060.1 oligosaccharide flippase family protein [Tetragenococcus koreensis]
MKNIAKNFFYQTVFQLAKIIMPIVTIPIVSNALGPDGVGLYNYTHSIAQYFVLFSGLGITLYGNRAIALAWAKKQNVSQTFWEIFTFKMFATILFLFVYFSIVLLFFNNKIFYMVQSLSIFAVLFDISWFFMGIEDFKKTSMSNLAVQVITFLLIIIFINDKNDVLLYTLIQASGMLLSQVFVWPFLKKYIAFERVSIKKSLLRFKGSVMYFIPQVAIMLYTNLNKTLLGGIVGSVAVGYYTNSLQLNDVFVTIITTLDVVLLPYMSGLFAKDNTSRIIQMMDTTIHLQLFFSIPIMFGMLTVFDKLVPWFFGRQFLFIISVIPWVVVLIIIKPLGLSISRQYLMPIGKIGEYNKSVIVGAIINIIANLILLPTIGFWGVIISTIISEFFVTFVRTRSFLKATDFNFDLRKIGGYFISGVVMCVVTRFLTTSMSASALTNIVQVLIAVPIYFGLTTLFKVNPLIAYLSDRRK